MTRSSRLVRIEFVSTTAGPRYKPALSDTLAEYPARKRRQQQKVADKFFDRNRGLSGPRSRTESPAPGSLASRVEKVPIYYLGPEI